MLFLYIAPRMKKSIVSISLLLCVLLLSGYRELAAAAEQASDQKSFSRTIETSDYAHFDGKDCTPVFKKVVASDNSENVFILDVTEVREEEEDKHEVHSSRKNRESITYVAGFFLRSDAWVFFELREIHLIFLQTFFRHLIIQATSRISGVSYLSTLAGNSITWHHFSYFFRQ